MHVNQPVFMIFFIPGCGCSRLALSVLRGSKTSSNNRRGEAEEGLSRRGVPDEGGRLGASSSRLFEAPCLF